MLRTRAYRRASELVLAAGLTAVLAAAAVALSAVPGSAGPPPELQVEVTECGPAAGGGSAPAGCSTSAAPVASEQPRPKPRKPAPKQAAAPKVEVRVESPQASDAPAAERHDVNLRTGVDK